MQDLTTPATPDQIMQCTTLVSHLTILLQTLARLLQTRGVISWRLPRALRFACRLGPQLPLQTREVASDFFLQFVTAFANYKLAPHRDIPQRASLG